MCPPPPPLFGIFLRHWTIRQTLTPLAYKRFTRYHIYVKAWVTIKYLTFITRWYVRTVVLNLGSIEPQGFVESVLGVRQRSIILRLFQQYDFLQLMFCWFCCLNTVICVQLMHGSFCALIKIYTYVLKKSYFIFPITKGSVNALMKLAGFSTSNKVKNHCVRRWYVRTCSKWANAMC